MVVVAVCAKAVKVAIRGSLLFQKNKEVSFFRKIILRYHDHHRFRNFSIGSNQLSDLKMFQFKGIMAAPVSPMTDEGEINVSIIPNYVSLLLKQNVKGVFICGSTGEGVSLSVAERKLLTESWIEHGKGRLDAIIVQCGANSLKDSQELASHTEKVGAHAIACLPPSYFKPQNEDCVVAFLAAVAAMAPRTPFLYYHIPTLTGVQVNMDIFLEKACNSIPNFHGIKCTTTSLYDFSRCLNFQKRKLCCLYGGDDQLLGALAMGGEAAIGSTYNYAGEHSNQILNAITAGDIKTAQELQIDIQEIIRIVLKYGGQLLGGHIAVHKSILKLYGLDVGPPRLPILPLSEKQKKELQDDLDSIGLDFSNGSGLIPH